MNGEFKYEVAFSFLQDDEQLALEIANRVRDRVSVGVFLYSERQDELVGTDGVETKVGDRRHGLALRRMQFALVASSKAMSLCC